MRMPNGSRTRRKNCSKSTRWGGRTSLTVEDLRVNMTKAANWKSTGPDRLPNFWFKQFKSLNKPMAVAYSEIIKDPKQTPHWLVEEAINLLPKKEEMEIPKNYRPISCLPTTFKIIISVITDRLYRHLEKEAIMTPEQRGGKKDCYECKDQLMINNAILETVRSGRQTCQQLERLQESL